MPKVVLNPMPVFGFEAEPNELASQLLGARAPLQSELRSPGSRVDGAA